MGWRAGFAGRDKRLLKRKKGVRVFEQINRAFISVCFAFKNVATRFKLDLGLPFIGSSIGLLFYNLFNKILNWTLVALLSLTFLLKKAKTQKCFFFKSGKFTNFK